MNSLIFTPSLTIYWFYLLRRGRLVLTGWILMPQIEYGYKFRQEILDHLIVTIPMRDHFLTMTTDSGEILINSQRQGDDALSIKKKSYHTHLWWLSTRPTSYLFSPIFSIKWLNVKVQELVSEDLESYHSESSMLPAPDHDRSQQLHSSGLASLLFVLLDPILISILYHRYEACSCNNKPHINPTPQNRGSSCTSWSFLLC